MAVFKCKMCGGDLQLVEGSSTAQCEYCGTMQTVPAADNERKLALFSRANRLRLDCEFDKAFGVYEAIVADFPEEAEAYWGLVLCKYGIEYVNDAATNKKVPTCHRSSFNSIMEDADFEQTLENADYTARRIYREEAKTIEEIRKGIIAVSSNEEPYDIFICYKETAENGERTLDSVLAQDIYSTLVDKGYRVFFSRITLEDKLGQEYEPYIFAALNSAKVMLAIGTDYEYYNAVWVKNEWSRYLKLMAEDHSKHLIPCYKDIDAYDIPKEFAKLQAQNLGKVGAIQDLLRGIDKLISPTASAAASLPKGAEAGPLLTMGSEALENGEWDIASSNFDLALTVDPMCAEAYLGKLMAGCKCKKREQLMYTKKRLKKNIHYKQAVAYADEQLKQELEGYLRKAEQRRRHRITMVLMGFAAVVCVAIAVTVAVLEQNWRTIINQFYSASLDAESAYIQLEQLSGYRRVDKCTQFLIELKLPGSYAEAKYETDLSIPKGVTYIAASTFSDCRSLTSITIPDGVISIGYSAFSNCSSLTSITIPDSVTDIGSLAFYNCRSLTSITIPDSVTSIGDSLFSNCSNLVSITIPDSVDSISSNIFSNCSNLASITIPDSVASIGSSAFSGCSNLTSITIPDSVTSIGSSVFYDCSRLTSVMIPDSVTSVGSYAFTGCRSLTSITIPDGVTNIGSFAFSNCSSLTSVTIPDSVTSIGSSAFCNNTKLTHIYCEAEKEPDGWDPTWNESANANVLWNVTN